MVDIQPTAEQTHTGRQKTGLRAARPHWLRPARLWHINRAARLLEVSHGAGAKLQSRQNRHWVPLSREILAATGEGNRIKAGRGFPCQNQISPVPKSSANHKGTLEDFQTGKHDIRIRYIMEYFYI